DDGEHRAENLLPRDAHGLAHVREDGRRHEVAMVILLAAQALAAVEVLRFLFSDVDVAQHRLELLLGCEWPEVVLRVHAAADLELFDFRNELLGERRFYSRMHEQPACPGARLPGERKTALHGEIYRLVEVGILHDDERVLAAELHLRARGERRAPMDLLARGR